MNLQLTNNLRIKRVEMGRISQEDLAKGVGVSRQTIISIENGNYNPSVKLAMQIAAFLKCKVDEIFFLKEEQ